MNNDQTEPTPSTNAASAPQQGTEARGPARASGWERADGALHTAGAVANGVGSVIVRLYGVVLILVGIAALVLVPAGWWAGLLVAAYGVYLVLPGSKFVIY